jgi:hypothetical protein
MAIQTALTLAMFGATGQTKQEILNGLKYSADFSDDDLAKLFESFTETCKNKGVIVGKYLVSCW